MKPQVIKSHYFTIYLHNTSFLTQSYHKNYLALLKKQLMVMDQWIKKKSNALKISMDISITLCGERKIRSLNAKYRQKNKITDVLSFPLEENPMALLKKKSHPFPLLCLGDIFICKEVASRQAKKFDLSVEEEMIYLGVHGLLHLLGYDHEKNDCQAAVMFNEEEAITDKIF